MSTKEQRVILGEMVQETRDEWARTVEQLGDAATEKDFYADAARRFAFIANDGEEQ